MKLHRGSFDRIIKDRKTGKRLRDRVTGWLGCTDDGRVSYGLYYSTRMWHIYELTTGLDCGVAGTKADAVATCEKIADDVKKALEKLPASMKGLNK